VADVADVREGGSWSSAQRAKNDVLFALASGALAFASLFPANILRFFGRALGAIAWAVLPSARRIAEDNVRCTLPQQDARGLVWRVYLNLGAHLGDAIAMLDDDRPLRPLPFEGGSREVLEAALREGRGVVFASAHLGAWERVAATLVAERFPLTVVAREAYDPRFTRLYEKLRGGRDVHAIYRGARGAASGLLRVLRRSEVLGIPMDLASRVPSIEVPFLGRPAKTAVGPARLALRTGAAVVVGTPVPGGALRITRIASDAADEAELTARINDEISARIRALPEEWVWMHPRFRAAMLG
jgi:KDO2-lipid IV(A) lauroyltransferase